MSGLEVVAAVAAIVSAFHGGSELLKHIKTKRRRSREAQQEFEEKKLQDSLVSGEQQISLRWAQDMKEFGDLIRVGDVVARDQLQHITIMMQGEIIKALQMAVQFEHAVLNLTLLQEASNTNKQATFVTLDQLKQRLVTRLPIAYQWQNAPTYSSQQQSFTSVDTVGTSTSNQRNLLVNNYIPTTVTLVTHENSEPKKHSLTKYFQDLKHNNSGLDQPSASQLRQSKAPVDINFSPAYQHFVDARRAEGHSMTLPEIDEITDSYQGLHISQNSNDSWSHHQFDNGYKHRRDTLTMPNAGDPYPQNTLYPARDSMQIPNNLSPKTEEYGARSSVQYETYNGAFDQNQNHHQQHPVKNPYPQMQTQPYGSRWSTASASSSTYSNTPSIGRNGSTSSHDSQMQTQRHPLTLSPLKMSSDMPNNQPPPDRPQYHDRPSVAQRLSSGSYVSTGDRCAGLIAPLSPQHSQDQSNVSLPPSSQMGMAPQILQNDYNSLSYSPYATHHQYAKPLPSPPFPYQHQPPMADPIAENVSPTGHRFHLTPAVARNRLSTDKSAGEHSLTPPVSPTFTLGSASNTTVHRHGSLAPSMMSTDSGGSSEMAYNQGMRMGREIRDETIKNGPVGQERMMDGRACKANNYWGFCRGAWATREEVKKGLSLRTQPSGMYNSIQIWGCTSCSFKGPTFSAPHPTKKNKQITIMDPRVATSSSGVRYKWLFLAKSHVRKDAKNSHLAESNYGCIICLLEDKVSSVYGGVETLMNHIALSHGTYMSETTRRKAKCIVGREARANETDWDINIVQLDQVSELA
ncbi:hypothetical protein GQ44DRAFT_721456 [Phaeosphaeriaceae sp. PMI808]|nr:hypothetical protein GQ44DRAFT_721456 [Phaeosphaeriaceae sp. PMI808]